MRVLKHAILGLLDRGEMSGYDIMTEFKDKEIRHFWSAKHSQIYPELKKLTDEGLIEFKIEIQGEKLEKKVYSITDAGKKELNKWLSTLEQEFITLKDEFMLKAYFISSIPKDEAREQFLNELEKHKNRLSFLEEEFKKLKVVIGDEITYESKEFGNYLVLTNALKRENRYCEWLEDSLQLMK